MVLKLWVPEKFSHMYPPSWGLICKYGIGYLETHTYTITRDKGPVLWQTILDENFPETRFLIPPPHLLINFPLVTAQNKFYANITPQKYPNFQQFQKEIIRWITAPNKNKYKLQGEELQCTFNFVQAVLNFNSVTCLNEDFKTL